MQSCYADQIIELRSQVESLLPLVPTDHDLHVHIQRANGDVRAALSSVVDEWELREEQKDYQDQQQQQQNHAVLDNKSEPLHLKSSPSLSQSNSGDLLPENLIAEIATGEDQLRTSDSSQYLQGDANFVERALTTPDHSWPGTPKREGGHARAFGLLDSPRKVDRTLHENSFWDPAIFGGEPAHDYPPKNSAISNCLMSCGPLPLAACPSATAPALASSSSSVTSCTKPPETPLNPHQSYTPQASSLFPNSGGKYLLPAQQLELRKRQLFQNASTTNGSKLNPAASNERLASIRSPSLPSVFLKPGPLFGNSTNSSPIGRLDSSAVGLSEKSLQATAAKCAVKAIGFDPIPLVSLTAPQPTSADVHTDVPDFDFFATEYQESGEHPEVILSDTDILDLDALNSNSDQQHHISDALPDPSQPKQPALAPVPPPPLFSTVIPCEQNAPRKKRSRTPQPSSSSSVPTIVLDDDNDDGRGVETENGDVSVVSSVSKRTKVPLLFPGSAPIPKTTALASLATMPSTSRPLPAHQQQQLLQRQQEIRQRFQQATQHAMSAQHRQQLQQHMTAVQAAYQNLPPSQQQMPFTRPRAPPLLPPANIYCQGRSPNVPIEVLDSDDEKDSDGPSTRLDTPASSSAPVVITDEPQDNPRTNSDGWPRVIGRLSAIITFRPLQTNTCVSVRAGQLLRLTREIHSDNVISVYTDTGSYVGKIEWLQARYLWPLMESKKVVVKCNAAESKELRTASDIVLVSYLIGLTKLAVERKPLPTDNTPLSQAIKQRAQREQKAFADMFAELFPSKVAARWAEGSVQQRDQSQLAPTDITSLYLNPLLDADQLAQTDPSPTMTLPLYMHQKQALTWMIDRETKSQTLKHPLFVQLATPGANPTPFWFSRITGELSFDCPPAPQLPKGGVLADEMGLGKTITTVSLIVSNPPSNEWLSAQPQSREELPHAKTTLIICPVSMMSVWKDEILRSTAADSLRVELFYGANRSRSVAHLENCDVVITSYSTVASEFKAACTAEQQKLLSPQSSKNSTSFTVMPFCGAINNKQKESKNKMPMHFLVGGGADSSRGAANGDEKPGASSPLYMRKWYRIVLDEAHMIRSKRTLSARAIYRIQSDKRWCLTGTPIHNTLDDIFSLLCFLRMPFYGNEQYWQLLISRPYALKDPESLQRIHNILQALMLRRTKDEKRNGRAMIELPAKHVDVVYLEFCQQEADLYERLAADSKKKLNELIRSGNVLVNYANILELLLRMRQFCDHQLLLPKLNLPSAASASDHSSFNPNPNLDPNSQLQDVPNLKPTTTKTETVAQKKDRIQKLMTMTDCVDLTVEEQPNVAASVVPLPLSTTSVPPQLLHNFSVSQPPAPFSNEFDYKPALQPPVICPLSSMTTPSTLSECPLCGDLPADAVSVLPCGHRFCNDCISSSMLQCQGENAFTCPVCNKACPTDKIKILQLSTMDETKAAVVASGGWRSSTKLNALISELRKMPPNCKAVVFSQWTSMLNIVEVALDKTGFQFSRLDGTMTQPKRCKALKDFENVPDVRVMLLSLRAGGLGLTLTCANYVFVLDPWWCPAPEQQAIDRVHRMGQRQEVFVKRFIISNTVEQRILKLQEKKQLLARTTVGTKAERKNFQMEDLKMLFEL